MPKKRALFPANRDKTKNITTTKKQFERLVQLLEKNPDIAKGFIRGNSGPFWNDCAAELNSLGPPIRDRSGWKKVWADYKSALKRKLSHNKREQRATGGGPNKTIHLSELEEQAVQLTGLLETVEGIPGCSSQGTPKGKNNEVNADAKTVEPNSTRDQHHCLMVKTIQTTASGEAATNRMITGDCGYALRAAGEPIEYLHPHNTAKSKCLIVLRSALSSKRGPIQGSDDRGVI
ncbi:uncharacterized protein LOC129765563 [Toxorhynchites rutilus septentrionalis]|uniref:uncharacterized protein LOC129765563 n=1 Tax=Toxorhynchites rutilus septentrionalis TaxID=329112 RepID=UPI0024799D9F|nr:uncharacterized protein LOC129765563 [Toxorhynchites rutilus septentrionalis]